MSSYSHFLPRIWGTDFLYRHHMLWDSTKEGRGCRLLTGHVSDLMAAPCVWAAPLILVPGWGCRTALAWGLSTLYSLLASQAPAPLSATQLPWCGDLLFCLTQNPLLSVPLGTASRFLFPKWLCESQWACASCAHSDSPENPRLVTKS